MIEKRWHVVRSSECSFAIDDPDAQVWTLSLDPNETGWGTDCGNPEYGLTKALAEELADAANAAWEESKPWVINRMVWFYE